MLRQKKVKLNVAGTTDSATTGLIDMDGWAGGGFKVPAGVTSVEFFATHDPDVAPTAVDDGANTALTKTVTAGRWIQFPDQCFGLRYLALKLDAAGTIIVSLGT